MITNEETIKAIEKYQKEHPLHFGTMIDVTAVSSKEGADIISQTIEKISKKVDQDTDIWCICEMAKMYMQGVKPVYPVRPQGEFSRKDLESWLYQIAMNNIGTDFEKSVVEIIHRLDGFERFVS
ncbi:MAG: hypothetical protein IIZ78_14385, partial [Clostridiales bacterium]|nr:hypothetical protein [Clostridiales bacterium]